MCNVLFVFLFVFLLEYCLLLLLLITVLLECLLVFDEVDLQDVIEYTALSGYCELGSLR
jgi:hypothetical protein